MRKLKFRVHKQGDDPADYYYHTITPAQGCKSSMWTIYDGDIVEQYTGVNDNKGVEIYEGDIIKEPLGGVFQVVFSTEDVGSCGCCFTAFSGTGFLAINYTRRQRYNMGHLTEECQVIGNIHTTPELLE